MLQRSLLVSQIARACRPLPIARAIPSPPQLVRNDEDFDNENSIIDLIERANTSTRDRLSHHVASSVSETKSESPSHPDQNSSSNDTVIPLPLPEHIPPTMSNRVSIQKQTPPSQESVNTTPSPERIPPTESNSRHHPTRLPVPSSAARSSTMSTLPSAPPPPYAKTSVGHSPSAHNQQTFPRRNHNSNINNNPTVPTAHFKPTVQPPSFPSVSSIEQDSPQNLDSYRYMQEEVLRMQLHVLQQKQRAIKIQPFSSDFKGKPTDLMLFLEKLSMKVNHHF